MFRWKIFISLLFCLISRAQGTKSSHCISQQLIITLVTIYSSLQNAAEVQQATISGGWSVTGANGSTLYYDCGGVTVLGGYCICGAGCSISKTFSGLDSHYKLKIKFTYWAGSSWDNNEKAFCKTGATELWSIQPKYAYDAEDTCGSIDPTMYLTKYRAVELLIPHSESSISLSWTNNLNQNTCDEWEGLVDVVLETFNCDSTCATCTDATATSCLSCASPRYLYLSACITMCPDDHYSRTSDRTCQRNFFFWWIIKKFIGIL